MILANSNMEGIHLLGIDGPWYVQLGVVFSLLIALSTVLRLIVWPGIKRIWQAIIAAPKLAEGVAKLVDLMEFDILERIMGLEKKEELQDGHLATIDAGLSGINARLEAHDKRADATERRLALLEKLLEGK